MFKSKTRSLKLCSRRFDIIFLAICIASDSESLLWKTIIILTNGISMSSVNERFYRVYWSVIDKILVTKYIGGISKICHQYRRGASIRKLYLYRLPIIEFEPSYFNINLVVFTSLLKVFNFIFDKIFSLFTLFGFLFPMNHRLWSASLPL